VNASDMADLLTFITTFDSRIDPNLDRVRAWVLVIDENITYEFAHAVVVTHYASASTAVTPADFNNFWKQAQKANAEQEKTLAIESGFQSSFHQKASPERAAYWVRECKKIMVETISKARAEGKDTFPLVGVLGNSLDALNSESASVEKSTELVNG
jgi:hypothetical protein